MALCRARGDPLLGTELVAQNARRRTMLVAALLQPVAAAVRLLPEEVPSAISVPAGPAAIKSMGKAGGVVSSGHFEFGP